MFLFSCCPRFPPIVVGQIQHFTTPALNRASFHLVVKFLITFKQSVSWINTLLISKSQQRSPMTVIMSEHGQLLEYPAVLPCKFQFGREHQSSSSAFSSSSFTKTKPLKYFLSYLNMDKCQKESDAISCHPESLNKHKILLKKYCKGINNYLE